MTRWLTRLRWWLGAPDASPDPTRPHAIVHDGVPIVHEGPPGFPGRPETADDGDGDESGDR